MTARIGALVLALVLLAGFAGATRYWPAVADQGKAPALAWYCPAPPAVC